MYEVKESQNQQVPIQSAMQSKGMRDRPREEREMDLRGL